MAIQYLRLQREMYNPDEVFYCYKENKALTIKSVAFIYTVLRILLYEY